MMRPHFRHPKTRSKSKQLKVADSVLKRDIFFIPLSDYLVACPFCHYVGTHRVVCEGCGKKFTPDRSMHGERPVVVVNSPVMNSEGRDKVMVLVIPLTTNTKNIFPDSVLVPADQGTRLSAPSMALVFDLLSCDRNHFFEKNKRGRVGDKEWAQIEGKLKELLDIDPSKIMVGNTPFTTTEIRVLATERENLLGRIVKVQGEQEVLVQRIKEDQVKADQRLHKQMEDNQDLRKENERLASELLATQRNLEELKNPEHNAKGTSLLSNP